MRGGGGGNGAGTMWSGWRWPEMSFGFFMHWVSRLSGWSGSGFCAGGVEGVERYCKLTCRSCGGGDY